MKKKIVLFVLMLAVCFVLSGCGDRFPQNALYVGANRQFKTIQSAIDACAGGGQTIVLDHGVYEENLYISKPICLQGSDYGCIIKGGCKIESDNVKMDTIVLDGKNAEIEVGIEISTDKSIEGLKFSNCRFGNFKNGIISLQENKTVFSSSSFEKCQFLFNTNNGALIENGRNITFNKCVFNGNGTNKENLPSSAVNINLIDGDYSAINFKACDFKNNGNNNPKSGALLTRIRGGEGDGNFKLANYFGAVALDNCLFVNNSTDIVEGVNNIESTRLKTSQTNKRGLTTEVKQAFASE